MAQNTSNFVNRALIVVDVQRDFCEGGSLAVTGGAQAASDITEWSNQPYRYLIATRDAHVDPGEHFAPQGTDPDYSSTWPAHCVLGTEGFEFHPDLNIHFDAEVHKGHFTAAYSGFEGANVENPDETLAQMLTRLNVTAVDVVGIAADHCVFATARDAQTNGFNTRVLTDLTPGVTPGSTVEAFGTLAAAGVTLMTRVDALAANHEAALR